jgi:hypothetical protein
MLELIVGVGETADAAEEGLKIITGMLVVGLIFVGVIVLGELSKWAMHRRQRSRSRDDVNAWRAIK